MPSKYPLEWPENWPRTRHPKHSRFDKKAFGSLRDHMLRELERLGANHTILSTDIPLTNGGRPRANAGEPADPGVAVYFQWHGKPYVIACDQYKYAWENIRAIAKTVEAMRTIERHGASSILERAVSGFSALPPGDGETIVTEPPRPPWWEVLGLDLSQFNVTPEELAGDDKHPMRKPVLRLVELMWKKKVKENHPDQGGSLEIMKEINVAMEEAREALA